MAFNEAIMTLESNKYNIKINDFEGPLDLLCYLVDTNKKDIAEIKISEIADQYIEYIKKMQEMNLEVTSEFLIMASNLIYLKSKKLLPKQSELTEEEELTEEDLIAQIIKYKQYKEITSTLRAMFEENNKYLYRKPEEIELPKQYLEEKHTKEELVNLYKLVLKNNSKRINKKANEIEKIAITETYSVGDSIKKMFRELIRSKHFIFNKLFSVKTQSPKEVITAFSGLLELSGRDKVITKQEKTFGDIEVSKISKKEIK